MLWTGLHAVHVFAFGCDRDWVFIRIRSVQGWFPQDPRDRPSRMRSEVRLRRGRWASRLWFPSSLRSLTSCLSPRIKLF